MAEQRLNFSSGDIRLEGVLDTPSKGSGPGVVLCHPHPLYGGDMDNNVVMAMCSGLISQGIAALRFNFRGVGGSEGSHDGGQGEQDDVLAALRALRASTGIDPKRVGLGGYSFGASMALAAGPRDTAIRALAAVAPPTPGLNSPALQKYPEPKLIIAGDLDSFIPIDQVQALLQQVAQPWELQVLQGADHFMRGHEGDIARLIGQFFAKALKP